MEIAVYGECQTSTTGGGARKGLVTGKWTNYPRRYCKSWEKDPDLKAWIRPIPYDVRRAFCLFCKRQLRAHHGDLLSHLKTAKHQRNESLYANILSSSEEPLYPVYLPNMQVETETSVDQLAGIVAKCVETELAEGPQIQYGILTVSDRCFRGEAEDTSGANLAAKVRDVLSGEVVVQKCVPDDITEIQSVLINWSDDLKLDVILTTGGTGFSPRDVTPEATKAVLEREAPGMATALTIGSLKHTSMGMLSRAVCGIRGTSIIVNLPGSFNGSQECLEIIGPVIGHAVDQLKENRHSVARTHNEVSSVATQNDQDPCKSTGESKPNVSGVHLTKVAYRDRTSPYPIISVQYAQSIIMKEATIHGTEIISYRDCNGRYLVNDIVSSISLPPFRASIKDGYAVLASDGAGKRKVIGEASAGSSPEILCVTPGTCIRISTGAPVPKGADAIVQVENTELLEERFDGAVELEITIVKAPRVGQDIRAVGSDIAYGETILERHQKLGPSELGLLAAVGETKVCVFKKPTVSVLSTGSEVVEPGETLRDGCIWDSNKTCIVTMLEEHGYKAEDCGIAKDTYDAVVSKLCQAFQKGSVVITTGGVSMGDKDLVKQVLQDHFNAKIHFGQVFMKPGKPTTFATCTYETKKKLIFALPGNPASAVVTFNLFVLPALRNMSGDLNNMINTIRVKLEHGIALDPRPEYHRAVVTWHAKQAIPTACTTGNQISSRLLSLKLANAILVLPPYTLEREGMLEGDVVDAIPIARI